MTVGIAEACRALGMRANPVLAVDTNTAALRVYESNFPGVWPHSNDIELLLDSEPGQPLSETEQWLRERLGKIDIVIGGPPCQGHSNLNNYTRRRDPKNELFLKMARFAEVVDADAVIIENVPGVRHDVGDVFDRTRDHLASLNYRVTHGRLKAEELGVAQRRHRMFMGAAKHHEINIDSISECYRVAERDFAWACGDLIDIEQKTAIDTPSMPTPVTRERIDFLFQNDRHDLPDELRPDCHRTRAHTYPSVYGRMYLDQPAPTITTGFVTMGQGRFVHPTRPRTLTPHEAARLQFFPDFFQFGSESRTAHREMIGNAVPPKFTYLLALEILR